MADDNEQGNAKVSPMAMPSLKRRKKQGLGEPTDSINIRAAVSDINAFVEFCERHRYTYGQGFRILVQQLE